MSLLQSMELGCHPLFGKSGHYTKMDLKFFLYSKLQIVKTSTLTEKEQSRAKDMIGGFANGTTKINMEDLIS
jgi:hypothetical protein